MFWSSVAVVQHIIIRNRKHILYGALRYTLFMMCTVHKCQKFPWISLAVCWVCILISYQKSTMYGVSTLRVLSIPLDKIIPSLSHCLFLRCLTNLGKLGKNSGWKNILIGEQSQHPYLGISVHQCSRPFPCPVLKNQGTICMEISIPCSLLIYVSFSWLDPASTYIHSFTDLCMSTFNYSVQG